MKITNQHNKKVPDGFEPVDHRDIRRIVGNLHVSLSCLAVCRVVKRKLKWKHSPPAHRRYAIAAAIQSHAANRLEFKAVNSGNLSLLLKFSPRYFFNKETVRTIIVP